MRLHLGTFWNHLVNEWKQLSNFEELTCPCFNDYLCSQLERTEDELVRRLSLERAGFVENSLRRIN